MRAFQCQKEFVRKFGTRKSDESMKMTQGPSNEPDTYGADSGGKVMVHDSFRRRQKQSPQISDGSLSVCAKIGSQNPVFPLFALCSQMSLLLIKFCACDVKKTVHQTHQHCQSFFEDNQAGRRSRLSPPSSLFFVFSSLSPNPVQVPHLT